MLSLSFKYEAKKKNVIDCSYVHGNVHGHWTFWGDRKWLIPKGFHQFHHESTNIQREIDWEIRKGKRNTKTMKNH